MNKYIIGLLLAFLACTNFLIGAPLISGVDGAIKQWHKTTLDILDGPASSEDASVNPFTDYRFNVTFTHAATGTTYTVPGYFAADGDAANSSADSGTVWRAHLSPDHTGT